MKTAAALNALCASFLLLLASSAALAQYKVVGPDGRVTYTDRQPSPGEGRVSPVGRDGGSSAADAALPYALRQIATRFPVVLYTTSDCANACTMARNFLARRGVPYGERVATSPEEREAWQRIVGGAEVPTLQVGAQSMRGFTPSVWEETLDVAGYPRASQLPAGYAPPAPLPLIAPRVVPRAVEQPPPAAPPVDGGASNPAGIRF
jgi:glutaredoxin